MPQVLANQHQFLAPLKVAATHWRAGRKVAVDEEDPIASSVAFRPSASLNSGAGAFKGTHERGLPRPGGGKHLQWQQASGSSLIGLYVPPIAVTALGPCSSLTRQCYTRLSTGLSDNQVHPASVHSPLHYNQPSHPLIPLCSAPGKCPFAKGHSSLKQSRQQG